MTRRPLDLFIWLLSLSLLSTTRAQDKPCTGRNAGKYYDLNGLQAGKDFTVTTGGGHEIILSACKSVSHETWGLKVQDPGLVGAFMRRDHGDFSMGQTNTTLSFSGRAGHPHLTLTSGSKCLDSNGNTIEHLRGSTEIEFICDPSHGAGSPRLVGQLPPGGDDAACAWFFEWRTAAACATSEGTTFGGVIWFLFISALLFIVMYLVVGTLYNYFILHLSGTEALPRFSLAGMLYHGREAWDMAGEWWASGRSNGFNFSSSGSARGPVGLGGPGGFHTSSQPHHSSNANGDRVPERGGPGAGRDTRSFGTGSGGASANPFVRTASAVRKEQPQPQTNPASHQTQVMAEPQPQLPPGVTLAPGGVPMSASGAGSMPSTGLSSGGGGGGLNPASHQAQLMAGMPVPHLSAPAQVQVQNENATAYRDGGVSASAPAPPPSARRERFALGDDEGEEGEGEDDAPEIQIADVRGRIGAAEEGGSIML
ncbi:hypothetical protein C8R46DRAFT_1076256 [Mycena filopes]|nr:hypothetical protein C8R46DRAFT_1076256 [Mycena filopes]